MVALRSLSPVLHTTIATYIQANDVSNIRSVARWCQHVYGPQLTTKQFVIHIHRLRDDPARSLITNMAQGAAWVAKHGRILAGLLHKMNRLVTISVEGNARYLREVLAHALSLIPRRPRLIAIQRVRSHAPVQALKPFPFLEGLPEGLALTLAQGRLCHLQQLDLCRYGFWRFLRHEPNRILLASAISSGAISRLTTISIEDEEILLHLLREAFQCTAAWQPSLLPLVNDKGVVIDDDNDEDDGQEQKEDEAVDGRHPHRRRQAMMKKLVVRYRARKYRTLFDLLNVPLFSRLQSLEFVGEVWPPSGPQVEVAACYIRSTAAGIAPCLRCLTINVGLTLDPLS